MTAKQTETPSMSEAKEGTPRTAAAMFWLYGDTTDEPIVRASFACQLERELQSAKAALERTEGERDEAQRLWHSRLADITLAESRCSALVADAERWKVFESGDLGYMREPLENARTGELVSGRCRWTIWWDGPEKPLFRDAVDAARAEQKEKP